MTKFSNIWVSVQNISEFERIEKILNENGIFFIDIHWRKKGA